MNATNGWADVPTPALIAVVRRQRDGLDKIAGMPEEDWHKSNDYKKQSSLLVGASVMASILPVLEAELFSRGVTSEEIGGTDWMPLLIEAELNKTTERP